MPVIPNNVSKPTLLLLGVTKNTDNYGVRVLLSSAVEALTRMFPGHEIALLDYGQLPERWMETCDGKGEDVRLVNLRFSWKVYLPNNIFRLICWVWLSHLLPRRLRLSLWQRNPYLAEVIRARASFALSGGDSFSDIYGLPRMLYVALPQLLVLAMGQKLVQLPQTYGPFRSTSAHWLARSILRRSAAIFSRDAQGVSTASSVAGIEQAAIRVVADLGLGMSTTTLPEQVKQEFAFIKDQSRPILGLNVSGLLYIGGYSGENMFGLRESFPRLIDGIIEHAIRKCGAVVLLIPHVCGGPGSEEDESHLCRTLLKKHRPAFGMSVSYIDHFLDHRQTKALIGKCDVFAGARMHACIAAVSQGVPSACLAYSDKFAGVMLPLGPGAKVIDMREADLVTTNRSISDIITQKSILTNDLRAKLDRLQTFAANSAIVRKNISR